MDTSQPWAGKLQLSSNNVSLAKSFSLGVTQWCGAGSSGTAACSGIIKLLYHCRLWSIMSQTHRYWMADGEPLLQPISTLTLED